MQAPSQFQQFVQDATGRQLKSFGAELFESADAYAADASVPPPADYVLGTGDEVRIQIWGAVDYNGVHTLDRNGQISLPKIGVILLNGVPVRNMEAVMRVVHRHFGAMGGGWGKRLRLRRRKAIVLYGGARGLQDAGQHSAARAYFFRAVRTWPLIPRFYAAMLLNALRRRVV